MKRIHKNKSSNVLNPVDDLTDADLAILRLRELREKSYLRQLSRRSKRRPSLVLVYLFTSIILSITVYILSKTL